MHISHCFLDRILHNQKDTKNVFTVSILSILCQKVKQCNKLCACTDPKVGEM